MTPSGQSDIEIGDRVIRVRAKTRSPKELGTVIDRDPCAMVRVGFEDGSAHWVHRSRLRRLDSPRCPDALAEWEAKHVA
jgi:hypothetical protein